jgi:hypothetical protein
MRAKIQGTLPRCVRVFAAIAMLAWPLLYPALANATVYTYQVCVEWEIDTVDSNLPIEDGPSDGVVEDQYVSCNNTCDVIARGVRIRIDRGGWNVVKDTSPTTGCTTFTRADPAAHVYDITVYAYATDANGNMIRMHDEWDEIEYPSFYPGDTISDFLNDVSLTPGGGANVVLAGNNAANITGMATANFSLQRYHDGLFDTEIHIGSKATDCDAATAHYDTSGYSGSDFESNSKITDGKHYIKLGTGCTSGTPKSRVKFTVAHEVGHAVEALYYGAQTGATDFTEASIETSYGNTASTSGNYCYDSGVFYGGHTKEWNSVAFREGFAHFYSARVWNNKASTGSFPWFSWAGWRVIDLERWGPGYQNCEDPTPDVCDSNAAGGLLENVCNGSTSNAATNEDQLRFLWDFFNADSGIYCTSGQQPTEEQMLKLYAQTRLNGGLTGTNYSLSAENAAEDIGLHECLSKDAADDEYDYYQDWNGVDH